MNSADLPRSKRFGIPVESTAVAALLTALISLAVAWFWRNGFLLYYGDAQAHLNISRNMIDSRTPGYEQLGTVWLPVLHLICLPFVRVNRLWTSGLAGSFPVAACFVVAGLAFFCAARELYKSTTAAWIVIACFALNPNILYLASIPMTEMVFFAGLAILLFSLVRFHVTQDNRLIVLAAAASWWMSLTRYDGWFLIPFASLALAWFAQKRKVLVFFVFGCLVSLAPLYWLAHNYWETGDALYFFRGPYSALAIQGGRPYPGYHDWPKAVLYYATAGRLCAGFPLLLIGLAGTLCAIWKRVAIPVLFLALTPAFYIWSIHSSGNPIHVPVLPPFSFYNTRYGIALVAWAAFASGSCVLALSTPLRRWTLLIPILSLSPWLFAPAHQTWICLRESEVNSVSRRSWTRAGAAFLSTHYHAGDGITMPFGDLTGVLCHASIPITESLHEGNGPAWFAAISRPDLLHRNLWVIAQADDAASKSMSQPNAAYRLVDTIAVADAKPLEIYKRSEKTSP